MAVKKDQSRSARRRAASAAAAAGRRPGGGTARGSNRGGEHPPLYYVHLLVPLCAAVVLLAVTAVVGVQLARSVSAVDADEQERELVLSAARQQALNFTTIGYRTVDKDIDRVIDGATGDFKASYKQNRDTIEKTVTKNKSTSKGEVRSAGVKNLDSDSATVLVVVDASVTNTSYKKPRMQHYRMQFDLAKLRNGKWLVSGVEFVG
ncbi:MAG: hypothetical protein GEV07_22685 [Streptosporangiales bacterium]|nr:hypothetical protein [Streptosporangiales bacterium]